MKLSTPFIQLPVLFDVGRLQREVAAIPASAWAPHPNNIPGNSALRLISRDGQENDDVAGVMAPTANLKALPYLQLVLASFGVVWSRSRLMQLGPGSTVPSHVDINYHWFNRVRLHIPIFTTPDVRFHCGDQDIHMGPGEAWLFDNWRTHRVENPSAVSRIHLVADTTGTSDFWRAAAEAQSGVTPRLVEFPANAQASIVTERVNMFRVMPPAEVDQLLHDLLSDIVSTTPGETGAAEVGRFRNMIEGFCKDWRQLWALFGDGNEGLAHYRNLLRLLEKESAEFGRNLQVGSNQVQVSQVVASRILHFALNEDVRGVGGGSAVAAPSVKPARPSQFDRPVIIVAAPRSGSTALFETLAQTPQFVTVGGEAHWLVEGFDALRPGAPGVESNRLVGGHFTPALGEAMQAELSRRLKDSAGRPVARQASHRLLEKTPKNALRIPFFDKLFPDARFVYLHRDAPENISSIIDAWRAGGWVTYKDMPDWDGDWSLLLPPGWRGLRGRPVPEIAAYQWAETNRIIMDDLAALEADRRLTVSYSDFVADPQTVVRNICAFADIEFDSALAQRVAAPLPLSRHTLTPPRADKWRVNAPEIEPLLPALLPVMDRISRFR